MPLHDWTRADAGLFHDFHRGCMVALYSALNNDALPADHFALLERRVPSLAAHFMSLDLTPKEGGLRDSGKVEAGGLNVASTPPRTNLTRRAEAEVYAERADRITVRQRHGKVVAVVEVVSPGSKDSCTAFRTFVEKSADLVHQGVHLLVIDVFPPGPRDPFGIHKAIWDEFTVEELTLPPGKPRTLASYEASDAPGAYVSFVSVGEPLPDMPLFLRPGIYVPAPLEASYQTAWSQFPAALRGLLEGTG